MGEGRRLQLACSADVKLLNRVVQRWGRCLHRISKDFCMDSACLPCTSLSGASFYSWVGAGVGVAMRSRSLRESQPASPINVPSPKAVRPGRNLSDTLVHVTVSAVPAPKVARTSGVHSGYQVCFMSVTPLLFR